MQLLEDKDACSAREAQGLDQRRGRLRLAMAEAVHGIGRTA
jgi:hypothetical protein